MAEGLKTVVAEAAAGAAGPARAEQMDLLGAAPIGPAPARGVGRPAGARNKRTDEWRRWLASSGKRHPLEFLIWMVSSSPAELCKHYEVSVRGEDGEMVLSSLEPKEVAQLQKSAAIEALPYFEQKLPTALEIENETRRTVVVIGEASASQQGQAQARLGGPLKVREKTTQNQLIIDAEPQQSDGARSDEAAQSQQARENGA